MITVDTGISAVEETAYARELNFDLIITDHHELEAGFTGCLCESFIQSCREVHIHLKNLAGVGVAFKLAHALLGASGTFVRTQQAIGTIADLDFFSRRKPLNCS